MGLDMNYEAEVFVETENLSREDWLAYRRKPEEEARRDA